MNAFTLRLEPALARKFAAFCKRKGYSKTGLVKSLIKDCLERESVATPKEKGGGKGLAALVGLVDLGGDSVKDKREFGAF